jgi:hypothetical protein
MMDLTKKSISDLAFLMLEQDGVKVPFSARPYLDAMCSINSINDTYIAESAYSIVMYFLSNAGTMRGDTVREVKAELKRRMKEYEKAKKEQR